MTSSVSVKAKEKGLPVGGQKNFGINHRRIGGGMGGYKRDRKWGAKNRNNLTQRSKAGEKGRKGDPRTFWWKGDTERS